jgi:hypothetical protein
MKLRAAQTAPLEASPEQNRVHLPSEFIDLSVAVILYNFAGRVEWHAVQPARRVNFVPARPWDKAKALQRPCQTRR